MSCPKCKGSMANLRRCDEILGCGTRLDVVSCILCGFRIERIKTNTPINLPVAERRRRTDFKACPTLGCGRRVMTTTNKTGICGDCNSTLTNWTSSATHRVKSPIQKFNNIWIKRDYRYLPGVA